MVIGAIQCPQAQDSVRFIRERGEWNGILHEQKQRPNDKGAESPGSVHIPGVG